MVFQLSLVCSAWSMAETVMAAPHLSSWARIAAATAESGAALHFTAGGADGPHTLVCEEKGGVFRCVFGVHTDHFRTLKNQWLDRFRYMYRQVPQIVRMPMRPCC